MTRRVIDGEARRRAKRRNLLHSCVLLVGMVALLVGITWLVLGFELALWALAGWAIALVLSPKVSPGMVLRLYRGRALSPAAFPEGYELIEELCRRAGVSRPPLLYYIPSNMLSAFTLGRRGDVAIAVTDGMLRTLTLRELAGVLAHEISHVANNDLWVMNLADGISRLTGLLAYFGFFLFLFALPLLLLTGNGAPLLISIILVFAPTAMALLQLALSRAREYEADLDAAALTHDPEGLASALAKLERYQARLWEQLFLPGRGMPDPSLLRTHPRTGDRIERLLALAPKKIGRAHV